MRFSLLVLFPIFSACSGSGAGPSLDDANADAQAIVGGTGVADGEVPYQASLQLDRRHICGATLIAPQWVVTAAHCVDHVVADGLTEEMTVELGATRLSVGGETFSTAEIIVHPGWDPQTLAHDIALVRLTREAVNHPVVHVIDPIAEEFYARPGDPGLASGWGSIVHAGPSPDRLQAVTLPIVDNSTCDSWTTGTLAEGLIHDDVICAGETAGEGACHGDSGGPLVVQTENGPALAGVASFVIGECASGAPTAFSSVPHHLDWITEFVDGYRRPWRPRDDHGGGFWSATIVDLPPGTTEVFGQTRRWDSDIFQLELVGRGTLEIAMVEGDELGAALMDAGGNVLARDFGLDVDFILGDAHGVYYLQTWGDTEQDEPYALEISLSE